MPAAAFSQEQKRVSISSKRQFTIPQKFFSELGFGKEALCSVKNGALIIEPSPVKSGGEFAEEILADLISQGYSGKELLKKFKEYQSKVRPAVERMLDAAKDVANNKRESISFEEIFGEDN